MAARRKARGKRSGPVAAWSEERRAARGEGRLTLRLPVETLGQLDAIAERTGESRAHIIAGYIRQEWEEYQAIDARRSK